MPAITDDLIEALLKRCLEHGFSRTSPVTLEITDANGRMLEARYHRDRDPEILAGEAGGQLMQPPLHVFAFDEEGASTAFTLPVLELTSYTVGDVH